jgi:hypothetical protein
LFVRLITHQPTILFSQNKPAISNQPVVLFSQNKSAPAISHQPNEQAAPEKANAAAHRICSRLLDQLSFKKKNSEASSFVVGSC